MSIALKMPETEVYADRPGWIPTEITHDWDTDPYAYQTEEELMPAGSAHGKILGYITGISEVLLESRGLMLLVDTFMLYRNSKGVKNRVAPDLLLMPFRSSEPSSFDSGPSSYDLDREPPPLAVIEVTSPKSHRKDLGDNVSFYAGLGIQSYLVIDAITPQSRFREQIRLHMWRNKKGLSFQVQPDAEGYFHIPEMNVSVKASGKNLIFKDSLTDKILLGTKQLCQVVEEGEQRAEQAEKQLALERQISEQEKQKAELLAAKLRSLGIDPDELMDGKGK